MTPLRAQPFLVRSAVATACLGCLCAQAQTSPPPSATRLETVVIESSADASAKGLSKPYAGGQVARGGRTGLLGTQDMMDVPFNAVNYTQALIQDQQSRSVADVLLNDPAVRNARGFGNFQELYVVRGFPIYSDDMAYNGLYGLLPRQYVAAELLERVEVMRGATAFLNGAAPGGSSLGGAINLLPKRATNAAQTSVTLGLEGGEQLMAGLDLSRRFGPDKSTGVRVNVVRRQGDTAIDGDSRELSLLAVGADWRGSGVRVSADLGHQDHQQDGARASVTPWAAVPTAPDASSNYTPGWTHADERQTFGTLRAEFDLGGSATAWLAAGLRSGKEDNDLAVIGAGADGVGSAYRFVNVRDDRVSTGEAGVRLSFATAGLKHELSLSAATFSIASRNAYAFSNFAGFAVNLYQPTSGAAPSADFFTGGSLGDPHVTQRTGTTSVALADSISLLGDQLRVSLGLRHQQIRDRTYNYGTGVQETDYDEARVTPMMGVLWKLSPQVSVYANRIDGLVRGDVAPATSGTAQVTNAGQAFAPFRTRQLELGAKADLGRLGGSAALFDMRKPSGSSVANADGTATYVVADAQRHRGLELSVYGEAARGVKLLGGASWIDAEMSASGRQAVGVPRVQANLGTDWTPAFAPDWTADLRLVYTGRQWADSANTHAVPAWTRVDAGVRWSTEVAGRSVALRARVDNLFGKDYWASAGGYPGANYLVLGAPRSVSISGTVEF